MAGKDSNRQVTQMVNFILQEAHEKVNEIRIKVKLREYMLHLDHIII